MSSNTNHTPYAIPGIVFAATALRAHLDSNIPTRTRKLEEKKGTLLSMFDAVYA